MLYFSKLGAAPLRTADPRDGFARALGELDVHHEARPLFRARLREAMEAAGVRAMTLPRPTAERLRGSRMTAEQDHLLEPARVHLGVGAGSDTEWGAGAERRGRADPRHRPRVRGGRHERCLTPDGRLAVLRRRGALTVGSVIDADGDENVLLEMGLAPPNPSLN